MRKPFEDVFEDQTKLGTKVQTDEYHESGAHIIVDQGQEQIAGYTDREEGIFSTVPAIIFGDHTRIIKFVDEPFFLGADGVKVLRCKLPGANYRYLYYALRYAKIPNTGYNRHFKWLKEVQIAYPDAKRQEEIVSVLDGISKIIAARQRQLRALDTLIKARFVEMFGDPVTNSMNWEKKRFDSLCENLDGRRRPITSTDRIAGPYPYYGASGIVDHVADYIFDEDILLISEDGANLLARSTPIAFSVRGKVWVNNHAHVLRFSDLALQKYIEYFFAMISIEDYITGSTQPKLNQAKLNAMLIPVPSKERMDAYHSFIEQVDKSKVVVQAALDKAQTLFDSLMQQYFG